MIAFIITTQIVLANKKVYLLTWGGTQTFTGAGHSSIAFEDSNKYHYYSHYPKKVGGNLDTVLCEMEALLNVDSAIGIQLESPDLVIEFEVTDEEFYKMKRVAKKKATKRWTLFLFNCSDFVKCAFKKTDYDLGYAFLISTPYELIDDINAHNVDAFQKGRIKSIRGQLVLYLKKEPRTVPYTLARFFCLKKR